MPLPDALAILGASLLSVAGVLWIASLVAQRRPYPPSRLATGLRYGALLALGAGLLTLILAAPYVAPHPGHW